MSKEGKGWAVFTFVAIKAVVLMGHCTDGVRLAKTSRSTQVIGSGDDIFRMSNQRNRIDETVLLGDTHLNVDMVDTVDLTLDIIEIQDPDENK